MCAPDTALLSRCMTAVDFRTELAPGQLTHRHHDASMDINKTSHLTVVQPDRLGQTPPGVPPEPLQSRALSTFLNLVCARHRDSTSITMHDQ